MAAKKKVDRTRGMKTIKVEISAAKLGTHKKGDVLEVHESTGNALIKSGVAKKK